MDENEFNAITNKLKMMLNNKTGYTSCSYVPSFITLTEKKKSSQIKIVKIERHIPREIIMEILSFLKLKYLLKISLVCKEWNYIINLEINKRSKSFNEYIKEMILIKERCQNDCNLCIFIRKYIVRCGDRVALKEYGYDTCFVTKEDTKCLKIGCRSCFSECHGYNDDTYECEKTYCSKCVSDCRWTLCSGGGCNNGLCGCENLDMPQNECSFCNLFYCNDCNYNINSCQKCEKSVCIKCVVKCMDCSKEICYECYVNCCYCKKISSLHPLNNMSIVKNVF
jgi:hypothetical protein